jgi:hypothetical protein
MIDKKFPLCLQAKLRVWGPHTTPLYIGSSLQTDSFVSASEVEALLEGAKRITGFRNESADLWVCGEQPSKVDTHSMLCLMIEPIAPPESEEIRLLREIVALAPPGQLYQSRVLDEAKAFLSRLDNGGES